MGKSVVVMIVLKYLKEYFHDGGGSPGIRILNTYFKEKADRFGMPDAQYQKIPNKGWPNTGAGSVSTKNGRIAFEYDAGKGFQLNDGDTMKYLNTDGSTTSIATVLNGKWVPVS